jgi:hypothetical protein
MLNAFRILLVAVAAIVVTGCGDDAKTPQPTAAAGASSMLCPKGAPAGKTIDANTLVGKTLVKARLEAAKYDCEVRPISVDGRKLANVQDVRDDRINVALAKGRIERVLGVY